ncbi:MAG: hypothetical protein GX774_03685, partial [Armatimonadetes bacterium]|nr:hypothetical protein [Armatimonadota bacterium]
MSVLPNPPRRSGKLPRVVLCESFDQRVVRAAHVLNQHKLAQVVLLGDYEELERVAVGYRTDLAGIDVLNYEGEEIQTQIQAQLAALGLTDRLDATDPVVAGAWLVRNGLADAVVAGAATTPTHVMRVYLRLLGVAEGCQTVSGLSLVSFENCEFVRSPVVGLADVSVVPEPSVAQLAGIAIQSAASYERMTG